MPTDRKSIDWYNDHAEGYAAHVWDENDSVYHSLYEKPAMRALLPSLSKKRVLAIGCGPGEDAAYLKSHGVASVVGIDIAEKLIAIAQKQHPTCEFLVMDMEHLDFAADSFDFAYSSLAVHYLESWSRMFREVYRVLKPKSSYLFSCGHPVYSAMAMTDDTDEKRVRMLAKIKNKKTNSAEIIGDYLGRRAIVNPPSEMDVTTWHKSIGEIAAEASAAGFLISTLVEPKPDPKMKKLKPRSFTSLSRIPYFLIVKLEKL